MSEETKKIEIDLRNIKYKYIRELKQNSGKWGEDELIAWLFRALGNGTDIDELTLGEVLDVAEKVKAGVDSLGIPKASNLTSSPTSATNQENPQPPLTQ